jgi:hypothetical protein
MQFTHMKSDGLLYVQLLLRTARQLSSLGAKNNVVIRHKTLHPSRCYFVLDQLVIEWVSGMGIELPFIVLYDIAC